MLLTSPASLVGRTRQLTNLVKHLRDARTGRPTVAALSGTSGIGKSRLLEELASVASAEGATVLRGGASQAEGMPPYLPFLQALGDYIAAAPAELLRRQVGSRAAILAPLLPEIPTRLGPPEPMSPLAPEQERYRLYEAVTAFLDAIVASGPLALLLDDLQWADMATCDLLVHVAGRTRSAGLFIVGAYRDDEVAENLGLTRALAELNRRRLLVAVPLQPLDGEECWDLTRRLLGGDVTFDVADVLHRQSEGNPFFLEELIRVLIEDGALIREDGGWHLRSDPGQLLPPRVAEAIRMRLARLNPAVLDLLRVAAVVGRSFEPAVVARVAGMDTEQIEDVLLAAARAQLLRVGADNTYSFTHDMVRETLYAEVGPERRRRLHGAIGDALMLLERSDTPRRLADLAFHFAEAGDRERGAEYALEAGRQALHASAAVEAMAHYRMALRLLPDDDRTQRVEVLMGLGAAATLQGDYPQAAEVYLEMQQTALRHGDVSTAALAWRQLGRVRWRQEAGIEAKDAFERVLALLGPEDSQEAAETLLQLADLHVTSLGRYAEGVAYGERALAMVKRLGDRRLEARACCVIGNIKARSNDPMAGRAALERSVAIAQEIDDSALAAEACAYLANVSAWVGDLVRSRELSLRRLALAERTHDPFELRHVYSWMGGIATLAGHWSEAERWFGLQEQALEGLQTPEPYATLCANRGYLRYFQGRFDEAEREYREAVAMMRPTGVGALVWYLGRFGLILVELGLRQEALECFTELQALADPLDPNASATLSAYAYLAVGYASLDERERAAACYPRLLPFRGLFAPIPADRALGLAAAARGDVAAARRHLADAEAQTRAAGMRPELALILLERGLLEEDRSLRGKSQLSPRDLQEEGWRLCEQLGMQELGQRILCSLSAKPARHISGLTDRELDVLRLVAQGRSNREIAQTLFLSEHTVARHLTHIFTKIGVENRAGAAAFALRQNLA